MIKKSIYESYIPEITLPLETHNTAYYFIFNSNKLLVKIQGDSIEIPRFIDFNRIGTKVRAMQYLGLYNNLQCFCMELETEPEAEAEADTDTKVPAGMEFRELRGLFNNINEEIFLLAGRAYSIVNWNRMTKFCGKCGSITESKKDERVKRCVSCKALYYPRLSPAVIVAIIKEDKILLAHNKNFKEKWYSVIAGFVEPGETFEDCAKREAMEEVGIKIKNLKYFGSQPWPFPDSLMIGFTAEHEAGEILVDGVEINDAHWYSREDIPNIPSKDSIAGELITWFLNK